MTALACGHSRNRWESGEDFALKERVRVVETHHTNNVPPLIARCFDIVADEIFIVRSGDRVKIYTAAIVRHGGLPDLAPSTTIE